LQAYKFEKLNSTFVKRLRSVAQQPLSEVEFLVEMFTKPGDLVVDPCGGAFTTGVACLRNYRRFFGCDVEQHWVANEQERVNKVRAELISNLQIWIEDMYDMNGPIDVVLSEWSKVCEPQNVRSAGESGTSHKSAGCLRSKNLRADKVHALLSHHISCWLPALLRSNRNCILR
jgi:hypothetical protein